MDLDNLQRHWNQLGSRDPMWAILTNPDKLNGRWDRADFFATGRDLVTEVLQQVAALNVSLDRGRALDFGCGIGRLTQALAQHFETTVGVDIAPSLIRQAIEHNLVPQRCHYVLNNRDDLSVFGDREFDFVFSTIVLQHMHPKYAARYIAEFVRVLRPGGLAVFQIPDQPARTLTGVALRALPCWLIRPVRKMDMYGLSRIRIREILLAEGAQLLDAKPNFESGPHWIAYRYFAQKNQP